MTLSIKINGKNVRPQYNGDRGPKPDGYREARRACDSSENAHIMSCLKVQLTGRRRERALAANPAPEKARKLLETAARAAVRLRQVAFRRHLLCHPSAFA